MWKIDRRGAILWSYNATGPVSSYSFALTLDSDGSGIAVATAVSGPAGWTYDGSLDLDADGRPRVRP